MKKAELIREVAKNTNYTIGSVTEVVNEIFEVIGNTVASGEEVAIQGFGKFERNTRAARDCVNPSTGEPMHVDAMYTAKFSAGTNLKEKVRG